MVLLIMALPVTLYFTILQFHVLWTSHPPVKSSVFESSQTHDKHSRSHSETLDRLVIEILIIASHPMNKTFEDAGFFSKKIYY